MASSDEYQQQRTWSEQNIKKPYYSPGDGSQTDINAVIYFSEQKRKRKYWFKEVKAISSETVKLFKDKSITNDNNRNSKEDI